MDLQTVAALSIVIACAVYVGWTYLRMLIRPESASCHCSHCPAATEQVCRTACSSAEAPPRSPEAREAEA